MFYKKLQASGITEALTALGYDCEKIFGGLSKEAEELYASYSWRKIPCSVEGIRLAYVVHAVPPAELVENCPSASARQGQFLFYQSGKKLQKSVLLLFYEQCSGGPDSLLPHYF